LFLGLRCREAKRKNCGGAYDSGEEKIHAWYEAAFVRRKLDPGDNAAFLHGNDGMRPADMRSERKPAEDHGDGAKHRQNSNERGHFIRD
jgi:hypothetical protein